MRYAAAQDSRVVLWAGDEFQLQAAWYLERARMQQQRKQQVAVCQSRQRDGHPLERRHPACEGGRQLPLEESVFVGIHLHSPAPCLTGSILLP
jgi:hypothetical protein